MENYVNSGGLELFWETFQAVDLASGHGGGGAQSDF